MTTETPPTTRTHVRGASGGPVLRVLPKVVLGTAATTTLVALAALVVTGPEAALAAALAGLLVVGVFSFGVLTLAWVVRLLPAASLVVALVTYAAQLALVLVVVMALAEAETFAAPSVRGWLAAALVVGTTTWVVAHLWLASRQRIPVYDLPDPEVRDA
jgi:ATP synthase protein I